MSAATARPPDPRNGIRFYFLLDGFVRLVVWQSSIALTLAIFTALHAWPGYPVNGADLEHAWRWAERLAQVVLAFNLIYIAHLLALRLLIPTTREGRYVLTGRFQLQVLWAALASTITRARYQPPFPGFLVFHLCNLPPISWLADAILGPVSKSSFPLDPPIPDPKHTIIGRNVTIGWSTSITAHIHDREGVTLKKVVVEDDVMIGANALIYGGCTLKRGCIIYGGAVVPPHTVIGENEAWGGVPARKIKDLPPLPWCVDGAGVAES